MKPLSQNKVSPQHLNTSTPMRKLQLYIATSLDMYIASTDGSVDWLFTDGDYGYANFYQQVDTILMGNQTFQQVLSFGDYPYADKVSYVFTTQPRAPHPAASWIQADPPTFIKQLKQQTGKHIWLVGGGQINSLCLAADIIDELILSIHPVWLGEGIPLFPGSLERRNWQLVSQQPFPSGLLQVRYTRQRT